MLHSVFFGTDTFSTSVLEELEEAGFLPTLIVTAPARKQGRGMELTEPPVKKWADEHSIETLQPEKLKTEKLAETLRERAPDSGWPVFLLASYGKIIPQEILDIPEHGILNVHPSLLPKYRGASPIQSQILAGEENIGVTIMLMDADMDHGPIVAKQELKNSKHEIRNSKKEKLEDMLAHLGGKLLAEVLPQWVEGTLQAVLQDHDEATFTQKITKIDGEINLSDDGQTNWRKFLAYTSWPGCYFFNNKKRIKITEAVFEDGRFTVLRIIPEGKKETNWDIFAKQNNLV